MQLCGDGERFTMEETSAPAFSIIVALTHNMSSYGLVCCTGFKSQL
jgi:hypothetical protein